MAVSQAAATTFARPQPVMAVTTRILTPGQQAPVLQASPPSLVQQMPRAAMIPQVVPTVLQNTHWHATQFQDVGRAPVSAVLNGTCDPVALEAQRTALEAQKTAYIQGLDDQRKHFAESLEAQKQQLLDGIRREAEQQKAKLLADLDRQTREREMVLERAFAEKMLELNRNFYNEKAKLEQQAIKLEGEYRQQALQAEGIRNIEAIQKERVVMEQKLATDMQFNAMGATNIAMGAGPVAPAKLAPVAFELTPVALSTYGQTEHIPSHAPSSSTASSLASSMPTSASSAPFSGASVHSAAAVYSAPPDRDAALQQQRHSYSPPVVVGAADLHTSVVRPWASYTPPPVSCPAAQSSPVRSLCEAHAAMMPALQGPATNAGSYVSPPTCYGNSAAEFPATRAGSYVPPPTYYGNAEAVNPPVASGSSEDSYIPAPLQPLQASYVPPPILTPPGSYVPPPTRPTLLAAGSPEQPAETVVKPMLPGYGEQVKNVYTQAVTHFDVQMA